MENKAIDAKSIVWFIKKYPICKSRARANPYANKEGISVKGKVVLGAN